jgi:hypothetical protein
MIIIGLEASRNTRVAPALGRHGRNPRRCRKSPLASLLPTSPPPEHAARGPRQCEDGGGGEDSLLPLRARAAAAKPLCSPLHCFPQACLGRFLVEDGFVVTIAGKEDIRLGGDSTVAPAWIRCGMAGSGEPLAGSGMASFCTSSGLLLGSGGGGGGGAPRRHR